MNKTRYLLENLPTILRRIDSGEIHIPQFQRNFVWSRKQIIQLFDSIYHGFFIGTLLFWRSSEKSFPFSHDDFITDAYNYEDKTVYMYVIDGTQRLRVLYNCLYKTEPNKDPLYSVGFDLAKETFIHLNEVNYSSKIVNLYSVFSSEYILAKQIELASNQENQYMITSLNKLVSNFVDYQLAIVVIDDVTKEELVTVFERLNTTGIQLSKEEILRARISSE